MKSVNVLVYFLLLIVTDSYANDSTFLCVTEKSTGFVKENGEWKQTLFKVNEEKLIIRKFKKGDPVMDPERFSHGVFKLGEDFPSYWCTFPEETKNLQCAAGLGGFRFSPKTGRFLKTHEFGYWDGEDSTPSMSIGRCSKI